MKTDKINQKNVVGTALKVAGLIAGFMVSGAAGAVVPQEYKMVGQIGGASVGALGAIVLPDDGGLLSVGKYAGVGMVAREAYGAVVKLSGVKALPSKQGFTMSEKLLYGSLGLACPDDSCGGHYTDYMDYGQDSTALNMAYNESQEYYELEGNPAVGMY
ncbi:hypothetical protein [Dokdonia sp.]|uniref:hypothetical protein n=1 Tax=Dokdonia sp. TaxID=2024995 RepID=UPI003265D834